MAVSEEQVEHTLEAEYGSIGGAERAISALEWAGIDAADVRLAGPAVERAYHRRDTQERDSRVARSMLGRSVKGALIGTAIAILAGGLLGLFIGRAYGLDGHQAWLTSGLGVLLAGIIGIDIGVFIGAETAMNMNEASEFNFDEDRHEPALVSVHVTDDRVAARALAILRAKEPMSLQHSENGRPVAA